jgi:ATP-binding cassette subfamily F protein uup
VPAITAAHVRKAFGSRAVLEDASFTLMRGERVGLIGANGTGKSTFAKIVAGVETADEGALATRRGISVRYLAQEPVLDLAASARTVVEEALTAWNGAMARHAEVTRRLESDGGMAERESLVAEQAELADSIARLGGWERGHEALGFLQRLGVRDVDRPCGQRSGGERRRIALAQLLVASPDVAILDEPTNHLDADTVEWLEQTFVNDFRGAVLLVTHDRYFLDAVAQRIVELERGKLSSYPGGYAAYLDKKAELMAHEERVEQNRQNLLRREREWLSRGPKARTTKQKARIQRAGELETRGAATAGRPGDVALVGTSPVRQGKTVLEFHGVALAPMPGKAALHAPFDLALTSGSRIGVVGPNGVGKTTLVRAVVAAASGDWAGGPSVVQGEIVIGKNTRVAYLDQARAGLDDDKSVFDDVRGEGGATLVRLGLRGCETMDLRSYLELLLFDTTQQRQKVGSLSGGERARVALAKVLREGANLLVFDEPTNDLDLQTLSALEQLLLDYEGSVVVVTHDRAFLDRVATGILAFESPDVASGLARVTLYAGGYSDYASQRGERAANASEPVRERQAPAITKPKVKTGLTYAERLELEAIVEAIDAAEKRVAGLEAELGDPTLYALRREEVAALTASLEASRTESATLLARWEWLEAKKSG